MRIKYLAFILTVCSTISVLAQTGDNAPYSRFGIGELSSDNFQHLKQMGGTSISYTDAYHINIVNPASYAFLRTTAFDLGVYAKRNTLTTDIQQASQWTGNLEYISLAFPLYNPLNQILDREKKKVSLGMSFTLKPQSTVSYDIASESNIDSIGRVLRSNFGEGGSYKFLWGNSIKYKEFAFGVNLGYLFGKVKYNRNLDFPDILYARVDRFSTEYSMKGFLYDIGLLYSKVLNTKSLEDEKTSVVKKLNVGLRFHSATSFSTSSDITNLGVYFVGDGTSNVDTAESTTIGLAGDGRLPGSIGFGLSYYHGEKYNIGIDYSRSAWSNYFNEANDDVEGDLNNTSSISIGGYIRPNYKSFTNYWKRVYYRFGAYHETDPRVIGDTQIKRQGFTMGMGLPFVFQRKVSHSNLGIDIGRSAWGTPIEETYVRFTLGFTFNDDEWFVKRKYN